MDAMQRSQTAFHLSGGLSEGGALEPIDGLGLRPALLARYRDLTRLRYDFPLVLIEPTPDGKFARSLTSTVNELAHNIAPAGPTGEALRKQLLDIEREIRRAVAGGTSGRLSSLWQAAVGRHEATRDTRIADILSRAGAMIDVDGELLDCDEEMPRKLLVHAWRCAQREKQDRARADIDTLIVRLNDILRADFAHSEAGCQAESLRSSVGTRQQALFDFDAMARLLVHRGPASRLSDRRRLRIAWALSVLRTQRFFPPAGPASGNVTPYEFLLDDCRSVKQAFRERLPAMAQLVQAMSIAELESEGLYDEARHDAYFEAFDERLLSPRDMAMFPDYLVCLRAHRGSDATDTGVMELLSAGIPVKILAETDDILEESSLGREKLSHGVRSGQLGALAVGLADAFVLQSTSSSLLRLHDSIRRGLSTPAPALFSVYTPAMACVTRLPAYLVSAAAMQSRAFPAFSYDPSAGADLATQFSLEHNPQPERDWPVAQFEYADGALQRIGEEFAFTLADFVATDVRYAHHFARVPHDAWNSDMLPVAAWLGCDRAAAENQVPCVAVVDDDDILQRLLVDERLARAARRCLDNWHRLQELGGIRSSHAERLLARKRTEWEAEKREEIEALALAVAPPSAHAAAAAENSGPAAAETTAAAEEPQRAPGEAWIETMRCSSCNECTEINNKMFAYDDNQQASIRDLTAGTYRELVEAAESCQLAIIHPGHPINPDESGLEELLERAQPFL
jgi:ferredoxin